MAVDGARRSEGELDGTCVRDRSPAHPAQSDIGAPLAVCGPALDRAYRTAAGDDDADVKSPWRDDLLNEGSMSPEPWLPRIVCRRRQ